MDVQFALRGRCLVARPIGEMDHHTCERIRTRIDQEYDEQGALDLIFDLEGIDFMDSSGIGLLMGRCKKASLLGGHVAVIHVSDKLDRVFQLSGLYKLLKKAPNLTAALILLQGGRS